jgi:histidyl-tRNA synthetase
MNDKKSVKKIEKIFSVKGMNDILPPQSKKWEYFEKKFREVAQFYSYENIRTPIVEPTNLFVRGLGEVTDIVEKEMYSFNDRLNGEELTLRPENTAGVVRAIIENSMLYAGPKRLYYMGPMFRHERPQRGRYRQFHQIGAEAFGYSGGEVDAELILMANNFFHALGLYDFELEINSLGQPSERKLHREALIGFFEKNIELLDDDAKKRLYLNPLRLLDSKNPALKKILEDAPRLLDFLSDESHKHLKSVTDILEKNNVSYKINPRLVRGMDYYNLTVFEFVTSSLGSQGTICAGGRYDYLTEQIGGTPTPAVGWAMGVERVLEILDSNVLLSNQKTLDCYAIIPDSMSFPVAMLCIQELRKYGVSVQMHASTFEGLSSIKSQFKRADNSGARYALIFGLDEIKSGHVAVKPMRDKSGIQIDRPLNEVDQWAESLLS